MRHVLGVGKEGSRIHTQLGVGSEKCLTHCIVEMGSVCGYTQGLRVENGLIHCVMGKK